MAMSNAEWQQRFREPALRDPDGRTNKKPRRVGGAFCGVCLN